MTKLNVDVIGLGMGRWHVRSFQSHPEAEVVAVVDLDEARLEQEADEYNVPGRYITAEAMFANEQLDIVSIATPNIAHKPLSLMAFEAGCHVLCEKPMAMNAAEARDMLAAAEKASKRLMINFSYRFTDQSMALKAQVDAGVLGEVYFGRTIWHRRRGLPRFGGWFGQKDKSGGGPIIDLGIHRLDLALWLMGYPQPVWVLASTYNAIATRLAEEQGLEYDVEDLGAAFIKFENGATLIMEASWAANIHDREMMETRLLGTDGGLVQRNINEGYEFEAEIYLEKNGAHFDMKLQPPYQKSPSAMVHLVDCILNDKPHIATGEEGLLVMQLLDAIYQSAAEGGPVHII